jgi:hypothetical protein
LFSGKCRAGREPASAGFPGHLNKATSMNVVTAASLGLCGQPGGARPHYCGPDAKTSTGVADRWQRWLGVELGPSSQMSVALSRAGWWLPAGDAGDCAGHGPLLGDALVAGWSKSAWPVVVKRQIETGGGPGRPRTSKSATACWCCPAPTHYRALGCTPG